MGLLGEDVAPPQPRRKSDFVMSRRVHIQAGTIPKFDCRTLSDSSQSSGDSTMGIIRLNPSRTEQRVRSLELSAKRAGGKANGNTSIERK